MRLDYGCKRKRVNVECDRLSSLPNDLLFKILSFIGFKYAIQTSVLSSRWRFIWTSMPYLNFSSEDFSSLPKFSKVVTHVLSRRNNHAEVLSVKLTLHGRVSQAFVKRVLNYAFSHNVQQMTMSCLLEIKLSVDSLPNLEMVDLCIHKPANNNSHDIVGLLQQFNNVKFLTLNLETLEVLSSSMEHVSHQPSPFAKLKSLKIYPAQVLSDGKTQKKVNVSNEVKNYLLDSSPSATLTMISHKEIEATKNITLAQNLMAELRVLLEQENAKIDKARIDCGKESMKRHTRKSYEQGKAQVLTKIQPLQLEKVNTCHIFSKLQDIQCVLTKLPTSNRAKMEACFSSLFTEASLFLKKNKPCDPM